jgi:hypothetical protein
LLPCQGQPEPVVANDTPEYQAPRQRMESVPHPSHAKLPSIDNLQGWPTPINSLFLEPV